MILTNPLGATVSNHIDTYPTPLNLTYLWGFGSIAGIALVTQIVSGVLLAMHYAAEVHIAFNSVEHIMRDVVGGWALRYIHANGASMFFIVVYTHMFRGLYYGSYFQPRANLWYSGVVIFVLMMATAFMGYVLPWGQMSFWGATVITNLFSAIPEIGTSIVQLLWGGFSVDNPTLNRFFSLHYLLPFLIAALAFLHLILLHQPGSNNPLGVSSIYDRVPFYPYFYVKDLFGLCIFVWIFSMFVIYAPNYMGHPDNYIEANPLVTPAHIVPEWYFLPFYAILRTVPDKLGGVVLMFLAIVILAFLPVVDTSAFRSNFFKPLNIWLFWYFFGDSISLGWIGQEIVESPFIEMGVFVTVSYFAYFMPSLSFTGFLENKVIASELRFAGVGTPIASTIQAQLPLGGIQSPDVSLIAGPGLEYGNKTSEYAMRFQDAIIVSGETPGAYACEPLQAYGSWLWNSAAGFFAVGYPSRLAEIHPALWRGVPDFGAGLVDPIWNSTYISHLRDFNADHTYPSFSNIKNIMRFGREIDFMMMGYSDMSIFFSNPDIRYGIWKSTMAHMPVALINFLDTAPDQICVFLNSMINDVRFAHLIPDFYFNLVRVNPSIVWEGFIVHLGLIQVIVVALFILFVGFFFDKGASLTAFLNKISAYYLVTIAALYQASIFIVPHYTTMYYQILYHAIRPFVNMDRLNLYIPGPDNLTWMRYVDFTRNSFEGKLRNWDLFISGVHSDTAILEHMFLLNIENFEILTKQVDMWLYNGYYEFFFILITLLFAIFFYGISDRFFIATSNELEFPILLFFFYIAALLVMLVSNLLEFVLAIEIITLGSYALAAYERKNKFSTYGGVQYFIIGSIPSALLILSLAILYRSWGTFEYTDIAALTWNYNEAFTSYQNPTHTMFKVDPAFDVSIIGEPRHLSSNVVKAIVQLLSMFPSESAKPHEPTIIAHHPELHGEHVKEGFDIWNDPRYTSIHPEDMAFIQANPNTNELPPHFGKILQENLKILAETTDFKEKLRSDGTDVLSPEELEIAQAEILQILNNAIREALIKVGDRIACEYGEHGAKIDNEAGIPLHPILDVGSWADRTLSVVRDKEGAELREKFSMYFDNEIVNSVNYDRATLSGYSPKGQISSELQSLQPIFNQIVELLTNLKCLEGLDKNSLQIVLKELETYQESNPSPISPQSNLFLTSIMAGYPKEWVWPLSQEAAFKEALINNVANNWIYNHSFSEQLEFDLTYQFNNATILSFLLLLTNFLFKITAAPFQFWAPSIYSKMPTASVTFLSIFTKVLILLVFLKLFIVCFSAYKIVIIWLFIVCGMLSIVFGMAGAFAEKGIKRFFVYSSMGHVGYMTVSLSLSTMPGFEALIHYITVYVITSFVMWFILLQMGVKNKNVVQFAGLRIMNRELAGVLAIIMFSMSGIPPLGGFFIKLDVLMALMDDSRFYTNYLLLFFSVATFFYYLRIIKILFFEEIEIVTAASSTPEISLVQNGSKFSETRQWLIFALFMIITLYSLVVNRALISFETEALNVLVNE